MLNLFYQEPERDRWLPFDRFPRRIIRRLWRGRPIVGGQQRVFLNLCAGLDRLGVRYRVNDYGYLRRHPGTLACVVGKPFVLDQIGRDNPILFGSAVFSHPLDDPQLLDRLPVRLVLVPGPWSQAMFESYYGGAVRTWPTGIDVDYWRPAQADAKTIDVLVYDKVRWDHENYTVELIEPVLAALEARGLRVEMIRYGQHRLSEFHQAVARARSMLFLCEHETQGFAYQEALAAGLPVLAWDRGGAWRDPSYWPDRVQFGPVTSVPYWDDRCGMKFQSREDFAPQLDAFLNRLREGAFAPREYILENLTLEACAQQYLQYVEGACSFTSPATEKAG